MYFRKKTKILVKIADNKSEATFVKSLFDAGGDVAWLNTAHQDEAATLDVIKRIRSVSTTTPIMIDTKGPEVRTKDIEKPIEVKKGDQIIFTGDVSYTGPNVVHVTYPNFHKEIPVGESILYDDATLELIVEKKLDKGIQCVLKSGGVIKNKKSLNIPNVHIKLPALSEKDKSFIHFCAQHNVDYIIHSFVRGKEDIFEIKDILKKYPAYKGKIISKLENREGFDNTAEILKHSDGLMVARGDLGAEVPLPELPYMQKKMVQLALEMGKYCIVATQVLESMIKNPRPTRAEVTDTANAILDGTGAISMSGETAYGEYPVEATQTMASIMAYTESKRDELVHFTSMPMVKNPAFKAAKSILAKSKKVKAIVVLSKNMDIVRALAAYRPDSFILPACTDEADARELRLAYAVSPVVVPALDLDMVLKTVGSELKKKDKVAVVTEGKKGSYSVKIKTV